MHWFSLWIRILHLSEGNLNHATVPSSRLIPLNRNLPGLQLQKVRGFEVFILRDRAAQTVLVRLIDLGN